MATAFFTFYREFLILVRDKGGLAVILLMPMALVLIITLVQDSAWKASDAASIELLLVNDDQGPVGLALARGLAQANFSRIVTELDGRPLTPEAARRAVQSGRAHFAIILPAGVSDQAWSQADRLADDLLAGRAPAAEPARAGLEIALDPELKGPLKDTFTATIQLMARAAETQLLLNAVLRRARPGLAVMSTLGPTAAAPANLPAGSLLAVSVTPGQPAIPEAVPNAVQHNVPAWTMFGMFFILIPMSGSIIRERNDGTLARLLTMPVAHTSLVAGRIGLYVAVCFVQLALMLAIGLFVLPLFGLPAFDPGRQFGAFLAVALAAALAATSFGFLTGNLFVAPEKAAMFGSITIVVLSALGGIMVPAVLMPKPLQVLGRISPLGWGMGAFNQVFVAGHGFSEIMVYLALLLGFALACFWGGLILEKRAFLER
jgi:ABC-2 type transport system permease protein